MKIYENVEQGSQEWFDLKKGKMSASHAQAIGNNGTGLDTYIYSLMAEKYSSGIKEDYKSEDMERGIELEAQAASLYELKTGNKVKKVGFIEYDDYSGCSPDRLVGEDGGCEIKCLKDEKYFKVLVEGAETVLSKYIWQIQMCLMISERKWWDLVIYNTNFKDSMIITRVYPDPKYIDKIKIGLAMGKEKIKQIEDKLKQ